MSKLDTLKDASAKKTVLATAMAKDDAAVVVKQEPPESIKGESTTMTEETISPEQQELNEALTKLGNAFITEHWPKLRLLVIPILNGLISGRAKRTKPL